MFTCTECGLEFEIEEMSDDYNVCNDCYYEERLTELVALEII